MLVNKNNVKVGDIVSVKLNLDRMGPEVVGKLTSIGSEGSITLSRPVTVQLERSPGGEIGISFPPFMISADDDAEIPLKASHILVGPLPAREDIRDTYVRTMSPLVLPPKSGLIVP